MNAWVVLASFFCFKNILDPRHNASLLSTKKNIYMVWLNYCSDTHRTLFTIIMFCVVFFFCSSFIILNLIFFFFFSISSFNIACIGNCAWCLFSCCFIYWSHRFVFRFQHLILNLLEMELHNFFICFLWIYLNLII
jgi:hypothetical protein